MLPCSQRITLKAPGRRRDSKTVVHYHCYLFCYFEFFSQIFPTYFIKIVLLFFGTPYVTEMFLSIYLEFFSFYYILCFVILCCFSVMDILCSVFILVGCCNCRRKKSTWGTWNSHHSIHHVYTSFHLFFLFFYCQYYFHLFSFMFIWRI